MYTLQPPNFDHPLRSLFGQAWACAEQIRSSGAQKNKEGKTPPYCDTLFILTVSTSQQQPAHTIGRYQPVLCRQQYLHRQPVLLLPTDALALT